MNKQTEIKPKKQRKERVVKRAMSVDDILKYRPKSMAFDGRWEASFGKPEMTGCWLVWGGSGNGKTRFTLQLCKYLTRFGKVAYNSIEEGLSLSFQRAVEEERMCEVNGKFILLDKEPIDELIKRLELRKSQDIIVIDSLQYSGLNKDTAKKFVDRFPKKLFIFVSHAEGKSPAGRTAMAVKYHANQKLYVEGYRVPAPISRFNDKFPQPFVIWEEGAERYWGTNN